MPWMPNSVVANRQLRTCPSAVSRTRSHDPQNGRVTEPITPTRPGPPSTRKLSAGADPRPAGSAGVRENPADRRARISSAVIVSARRQPCWASRGICSIKRSWYPWSRQNRSSPGASWSLTPRISTAFTFTGSRPAAAAAARPASTSGSRSRPASSLKVCRDRVSRETFSRSSPAAASGAASRARPMPSVVSEISGRGSSVAAVAMRAGRPRRSSGSPPVNRASVTPSRRTATEIRRESRR
jgi:hypothetical protein